MIADTLRCGTSCRQRHPLWVDLWGHDVNHDWPWWRKQFPYFLEKLYQ